MRNFLQKLKRWWSGVRKYMWIAVFGYIIHLAVEGFVVNVVYFNVIKPAYLLM